MLRARCSRSLGLPLQRHPPRTASQTRWPVRAAEDLRRGCCPAVRAPTALLTGDGGFCLAGRQEAEIGALLDLPRHVCPCELRCAATGPLPPERFGRRELSATGRGRGGLVGWGLCVLGGEPDASALQRGPTAGQRLPFAAGVRLPDPAGPRLGGAATQFSVAAPGQVRGVTWPASAGKVCARRALTPRRGGCPS